MSLAKIFAEQRRLGVLQLIAKSGYALNADVLSIALGQAGIPSDAAETLAALQWLSNNNFVLLRTTSDAGTIAQITNAGVDIVERRRVAPGVAIPGA